MDDQPAPMADDAEAERGNDPVVVDDTEAERVAAALVDRVDAVGPNRLLGRVGNFTNDNPTAAGLFFLGGVIFVSTFATIAAIIASCLPVCLETKSNTRGLHI